MNQPAVEYLARIRDHPRYARDLVQGLERDDFLDNRCTYQAVLMSLLIIGEAAAKITEFHPEMTAHYHNVPWRSMRGMRNRIAHDYFSIVLNIVWETVQQALPHLLVTLDKLP